MPHDSTMRDAEARRSLKADLARIGEESLFEVNDTPAMKALGYYREQTK